LFCKLYVVGNFGGQRNEKRRSRKPKVEANLKFIKKMKKTFLNFGLILALGLTTAVFNSCNKDDDKDGTSVNASKITATNVVNSSTQIKTVKALADWVSGYDYGTDAIAHAPYQNDGFTLELPATLGDKYLETFDEDDLEGISVSDKKLKLYLLDDLKGYNKDDEEIGFFYSLQTSENSFHYTSRMYVDRDATIKGENKETNEYGDESTVKFDLTLKKGWNIVYFSLKRETKNDRDAFTLTYSSKKPSGVNYTWYFYGNEYRSASVELKSAINSKSFFSKLKGNKKR